MYEPSPLATTSYSDWSVELTDSVMRSELEWQTLGESGMDMYVHRKEVWVDMKKQNKWHNTQQFSHIFGK